MGKIVALDFGLKRTGIAISDDSKVFAFSLKTIESKDLNDFLEKIILKEQIDLIVIGEPKKLNNEDSHITQNVYILKKYIEKQFKQKVILYDERFTSKIASQAISESGLSKSKRKSKELIDEISATLILQSYLKSIN